jgi:MoaA/NifB/PqqE/SkfB family radical SAM enzyme
MTGLAEIARRTTGAATNRLRSLPILALTVHSACNCKCVMCDIWKANADGRELSVGALRAHVQGFRRLRVQRVMLTGGEPLLNRSLRTLVDLLAAEGIRVTLVTTGLLIESHADFVARAIDTVVVSLDGPPAVHDAVRRVPGGFARLARGVSALRAHAPERPRLIARSVVQRLNYACLAETIRAAREAGFDEISFLAADVWSTAFNRPEPWSAERQQQVAVPAGELAELGRAVARAVAAEARAFAEGFVTGGEPGLARIVAYYQALAGADEFPPVRCNAPWVSAVLELDGRVRPCFFHEPYAGRDGPLDEILNAPDAVAFRRRLDPATDPVCRRCVCSLRLGVAADVQRALRIASPSRSPSSPHRAL